MNAVRKQGINPLICLDYPDPDVIRVDDTYYMVSTTMHFMPGCEILRSYDLVNWEHASYVYDVLDSTPAQKLEGEQNIYGKGMWAACLRYHKGTFYICFVANDTKKTYLYSAPSIEGPWKKDYIQGFYHDCSILFDDDDRVYIASGNKYIRLQELKADLSGPKEGGIDRIIAKDEGHPGLGYEGTHFYKINGKYYLFFIHSLREQWKRVEACFVSSSLEGEFLGGDVLNDDMGYYNQGVAQGGIVDTPDGKWYAVLFQDRGAVGRIPVLIPISWENDYPVFGENGKIPAEFEIVSTRPDYQYMPLVQSDDFKGGFIMDEGAKSDGRVTKQCAYDSFGFKSCWQFNHEPDLSLVKRDLKRGTVEITTDKLCKSLTQAKNILTQRMRFPACAGEVTVDASSLKEGDYAGICALQGCYGMVAVTKEKGKTLLVMKNRLPDNSSLQAMEGGKEEILQEIRELHTDKLKLKIEVEFEEMKDEAKYYFDTGKGWTQIGGSHKLYFRLDHFTGCRFGLFIYGTKEIGGSVRFSEFVYRN
ncbi:MAG: Beta-xylosidase [Lachnoclostridium sp.]|jgi:beta-xylosidase